MGTLAYLQALPAPVATALVGVLGLLIGSFLNVVVHRLPRMLERQWAAECAALANQEPAAQEPFNLVQPRSRCPHCGHAITWYENIPVLSFLALRGRCSACKAPIAWRYPLLELACGGFFALCAARWGMSASTLAWCAFSAVLLALAAIDWDTTLLPDDLTLPLLWLGLVAAALRWTPTGLEAALWGAVAGYLSLWLVYWAFKLATGKEGMGYGDFKLYAALGAWFGWQTLIPLILIASIFGAVIGVAMHLSASLREGRYIPFGPFLALAGFSALVADPLTLRQWIGL